MELNNIKQHLESAGELTRSSFEDTVVNRDNLEDFRIHICAALTLLTEAVEELSNQK